MASAKLQNKLVKTRKFLTAVDKRIEILFYHYPPSYLHMLLYLPGCFRHFQANFQVARGNGSMQIKSVRCGWLTVWVTSWKQRAHLLLCCCAWLSDFCHGFRNPLGTFS